MAFSFFGTFSTGQWNQLRAFGEIQRTDLTHRLLWLQAQLLRVGVFACTYDKSTGYPISFTATKGSYSDKLLQAYRILGGVPEQDMLLRNMSDPVFLTKSTPLTVQGGEPTGGSSTTFSNSRESRGVQRFDRDLGLVVTKYKAWQLEVIKHKREHLEFKIKRALDYSDSLAGELKQIGQLLGPITSNNSLDRIIVNIEIVLSSDQNINTVKDDADLFGLGVGQIYDRAYPQDNTTAKTDKERGTV